MALSSGKIEIREYAPMIVAEAEVSGDRRDAISKGVRQLWASPSRQCVLRLLRATGEDWFSSGPLQSEAPRNIAMAMVHSDNRLTW